jgi:hypothetical protein
MTTATMERDDVDSATEKATILQRAVCLVLHCGAFGNNRKVDLKDLSVASGGNADALDEEQFHATMRLINPKTLLPPKRVQSQAKAYLHSIGIPAHRVFGESTVLIPLAKVTEAWDRLRDFEAELATAAKDVADNYEAACVEQDAKLGPLAAKAAKHRKTPREVEQSFTLEYSFVSFASPENLEIADMAVAMASRQKFDQQLSDLFDEVALTLRSEALTIAQNLVGKLAGQNDGKPRILRNSAFSDFQNYVAQLPTRNLSNDDELVVIMERLQKRLDGVNVADLRDSASLRAAVAQAAQEATDELAGLVATTRGRAISFGGIK